MPLPNEKQENQTPERNVEDIFEVGSEKERTPLPEREAGRESIETTPPEARPEHAVPSKETEGPSIVIPPQAPGASIPQAEKSQALIEIENILSQGLEEIYLELPLDKQILFQKQGEETASKILVLMQEVRVQVAKVLQLIRDWLKIIPGVNKFFLEQEAKIKADRLLALRDKQR